MQHNAANPSALQLQKFGWLGRWTVTRKHPHSFVHPEFIKFHWACGLQTDRNQSCRASHWTTPRGHCQSCTAYRSSTPPGKHNIMTAQLHTQWRGDICIGIRIDRRKNTNSFGAFATMTVASVASMTSNVTKSKKDTMTKRPHSISQQYRRASCRVQNVVSLPILYSFPLDHSTLQQKRQHRSEQVHKENAEETVADLVACTVNHAPVAANLVQISA